MTQQLVARIKRSSKYFGQTPPLSPWFEVHVVEDDHYQLRGNSNNYRVCDVVMGMRLSNGSILDLTNSKIIPLFDLATQVARSGADSLLPPR